MFLFIFILFDTSVAFYASMFCDSVQISRLCDSFFHLSLIRVDALSVLGTIFLQIVSAGDAILYYILKVL